MECMVFKARIGNVISIQFNFTNQSNYYGILKCIDHHLENELPDMLTDTCLFLKPASTKFKRQYPTDHVCQLESF